MPHQCLKCGKVFPSGSMEIFKGCSNCKGKRFFYTEQPIADEEREILTERANKDIKELVRDLLTQRRPDEFDEESSGWVKVDKDMNVEAASKSDMEGTEVSISDVQSRKLATDELKELGGPREIKSKLQEILNEEFGERKEDKAKPDFESVIESGTKDPAAKDEEKAERVKPAGKKPVREIHRKPLKRPESKTKPEVITIVEPGVYEIDLEQLMDRSPIIILKDGTYLLHLPSLFNKPIKK
jgi:predicted  nucleic acid-binding Zn-ribbon protein